MPRPTGAPLRRSRRSIAFRALAAVAALAATAVVDAPGSGGVGPSPAGAAGTPPITVKVTPATDLTDGQPIAVEVDAAPGVVIGSNGVAKVCRPGETYTTAQDVAPLTGKCPLHALSS